MNLSSVDRSFVVFRQPWGDHEWDSCEPGQEKLCAEWHGAVLVFVASSKSRAEREVRILNGWN